MAGERAPIDISHSPELVALAEEAQRAQQPRVLRRADEDVAILMPVTPGSGTTRRMRRRGKPTSATDPLWTIVGIGQSSSNPTPTDVSRNKRAYLAQAYADLHRHESQER